MVVTCPKCSTGYEFDETLIGPKGTVVRCTQCSHMFKIFADDSDDAIAHAGWMIRKASGRVFGIDKFSTIQKWIREGKIDAEDSLSRTGKSWKKLGEIVELQGIFAALDKTRPGFGPTPPTGGMVLPPRLSIQGEGSGSAPAPVSPRARDPEPLTRGAHPAAQQRKKPEITYESAEPEQGTVKGALARTLAASEVSAVEEKEDRLLRTDYHPGRWKRWLVVVIVLVLVGAGVLGYFQRDLLLGWFSGLRAPATQGEHERALERAHEYFLLDTGSYFDQAEKIYRELLEKDEQDTGARAGLAELLAARAQNARDMKDYLGMKPGVQDEGTLAREAKKLAQLAVLAEPDSLVANRAAADALRLAGDIEGAREHINKALDLNPKDPETLYVATLVDQAEGVDDEKIIDDLERILKRSETLLRVRYRLALLFALTGQSEASRREAEKILEMNADHELAANLLAKLKQGGIAKPEPAVEPEPEEGEVVAEAPAGDEPPPPEKAVVVEPPKKEPAAEVEPAGVPGGKSFDFYISKAQKYRSSGDCSRAIEYFEMALELNPSNVEALTGSGYCHMSQYQYGPAVSEFKRALKTNKNYAPAIIGLAQAYEKKGNIKGAVEYYKKYLDSYSSGSEAGLARNKIKELEDTIGPGDAPTGDEEEGEEQEEEETTPKVIPKTVEEVEIKSSVGQPSSDTPKTAGDPYD